MKMTIFNLFLFLSILSKCIMVEDTSTEYLPLLCSLVNILPLFTEIEQNNIIIVVSEHTLKTINLHVPFLTKTRK